MKRLLFIILLSILGTEARCVFFEEGKKWEYEVFVQRTDTSEYYFYYMLDAIDGDTVVENKACKKIRHAEYYIPDNVWNTYDEDDGAGWWKHETPDNVWWTYEYEDSNRVYRYYDDASQGFKMIMDFNLQPGDSIKLSELYLLDFVVDWVGYISFRDISRKTISFRLSLAYFWIEDIGYTYDENIYNLTNPKVTRQLYRCYKDEDIIFCSTDIVLESLQSICFDMDKDLPIYDLMGRRVEHPQRGSLYIRGGKKIIWQDLIGF